jgi:2'-5' RNA ligase
MSLTPPPLILTLKLDQHAFDVLDALRARHFPPERNFLPAHVTLFHALPGDQEQAIAATLHELCAETTALHLSFPKLRLLGKGVAVEIESADLIKLRKYLIRVWDMWLGMQDRQGFRPHVTIQNKVTPATARRLFDELRRTWQLFDGRGEALLLWRYRGGPWELVDEFTFNG